METVTLRMRYIHIYPFIQLCQSCFIQLFDYSHLILSTADKAYASLANWIMHNMHLIAHLHIHSQGELQQLLVLPEHQERLQCSTKRTSINEVKRYIIDTFIEDYGSNWTVPVTVPVEQWAKQIKHEEGIANVIVNVFVRVCCKYLQNLHIK